ncbi:MAG: MarC family protein [Myxococcales bacterium]|nr:MarC family protein [Myxococcales bacterium]
MKLFLYLLVILNPFSQVVYLADLMRELPPREFARIHLKASALTFGVFGVFVLFGDRILTDYFQIRLASLQIFGGLLMVVIAYRYITIGAGSNSLFRGDVSTFAATISIPYMVGAGTIWTSILIGREYDWTRGFGIVAGVLAINLVFVTGVQRVVARASVNGGGTLEKYFSMLTRTNALFIGAVGVEMILRAIETTFLST